MSNFSCDADLMTWEPEVFRLARMAGQKLAAGTGSTSAASAAITDAGADFVAAGVEPGHVVHAVKAGTFDLFLPIEEVSGTSLVLRTGTGTLGEQTGVEYEVHTFDPQHEEAHFELCRRFCVSMDAETDFGETQIAEARTLRRASAFRVLESVFRAQASDPKDLFWQKGVFYGELYAGALAAARVRFDTDGDGKPEVTRAGHDVRLRVEQQGDAWK